MRTEVSEPLLSVVVTTRNDDHGGDLNRRTQLFIDGLAAQAERHRVPVELIVVEWNPPDDRPSIADVLQWPTDTEHFEARVIVVPRSLHLRLKHSEQLRLFQMIAKNVGIRRARGRFIVASNVDVLFSHELMNHIARGQLSEDALYRVDRYDVESDVPDGVAFDDCLAWCDAHVLRICKREGTFDLREDHFYRIYESLRVPIWFAGYIRIGRALCRKAWLEVSRGAARFHAKAGARSARTQRRTRESSPRRSHWALIRLAIVGERARLRLHTNACGDFTLMSRAAWERVGGYPELELFSMHIDSTLLYQAHYTGIHEVFLPYRLYHIEHTDGFRPDPAALDDLNKRLEENAIPQISDLTHLEDVIEMYRTGRPKFQNPDSWGFATEPLEDRRVVERLKREEPMLHRGPRAGV